MPRNSVEAKTTFIPEAKAIQNFATLKTLLRRANVEVANFSPKQAPATQLTEMIIDEASLRAFLEFTENSGETILGQGTNYTEKLSLEIFPTNDGLKCELLPSTVITVNGFQTAIPKVARVFGGNIQAVSSSIEEETGVAQMTINFSQGGQLTIYESISFSVNLV